MKNIVNTPNYLCFFKIIFLLTFILCINGSEIFAQTEVPFTARYSTKLRGDLTLISNNIVNRDEGAGERPNDPYNGFDTGNFGWVNVNGHWEWKLVPTYNDNFNMRYIDVDSDGSTFSSSKATLNIPNNGCLNVKFAGLYWGAIYKETSRATDYNQVKFKLPGTANYIDITASDIIFDAEGTYTPDPYACFADVTGYLQSLATPVGEYTVANIRVNQGKRGSGSPTGGAAGGWTLVVVYEDPLLSNKNITVFDGFSGVKSGNSADISVSGFTTIPVGPVNARIGVSCIEGDANLGGDGYSIKSASNATFTVLSDPLNPPTNFFNSSITIDGVQFVDKVPNSLNNLGWDTDLFEVTNPANSVIGNDETAAILRINTNSDSYFVFQTSFAIEIIEPKITVLKTVDDGVNDISGSNVTLGDSMWYQLRFQNTGNDNATNTTIKDYLPINVDLDESSIILPWGVTYSYTSPTPSTGGIIEFTIDDSIVTKGGTSYDIRFKVTVTDQCNDLRDACENKIDNVAFAYYTGLDSGTQISDDPSFYGLDNCDFGLSGATNFLVDVDGCTFNRDEVMCGASLDLTAGNGYVSYVWRDAGGNIVGNTQTITVNNLGVYTVDKTAAAPCVDATETITVVPFGTQANPLIDQDGSGNYLYVDDVKICPNDGRELSEIYLCGTDDYKDIVTNIAGAQEINWQKLATAQEGTSDANCPNVDITSNWTTVDTTNNFKADTAGEYRLKIVYPGGCFVIYYFNVFKSTVQPVIVKKNINCGNDGNITINNIDTTLYEFSVVLDGQPAGAFSSVNSYPISVAGNYTVYFRQIGAIPSACIPTIQGINIATRDIDTTITVTDILCPADMGGIRVQVNNVPGDYTMVLHTMAGNHIGTYGPDPLNDHLFDNLAAGNYRVTVTTPECSEIISDIQVKAELPLELTAVVSQNITCKEGNIQMSSSGGQTPHNYAIHSYKLESDAVWTLINPAAYDYQTSQIFDIPTVNGAGEYRYLVVDKNLCTAVSNIVKIILEPDADYDILTTDINCFGDTTGVINFVLNDNTKNILYALDDGIPGNGIFDAIIDGSNPTEYDDTAFDASSVFINLPAGDYTLIIRIGNNGKACFYPTVVTLTQPNAPLSGVLAETQPLTCNQLGEVTVTAAGGTPPYQYAIDGINFVNNNVFTGLLSGSKVVTIRDDKGCEIMTNAVVFAVLDKPTDITITETQITCPSLTSDITVATVSGGTMPFVYEIIAPASALINNGNNPVFTDLVADTYRIKVTDALGCSYEEDYTIAPISEISIIGVEDNQVICKGSASGNATFTVSGFTTTYSYSLNANPVVNGQNNNSIPLTNLIAGNYTITITDDLTLCTDVATVTITEPAVILNMSLSSTPITCATNATITVSANGGWGALEYQLENTAGAVQTPYNSDPLFINVLAGDYIVFVRDANGCIIQENISINAVVVPTIGILADTECYTAIGNITITATGTGTAPLQYALNGGTYQTNNVFANILPGNHSVTVKDVYGCEVTSTTITVFNELTLSTQFLSISACTNTTDVTITANGGDGTYSYTIQSTGNIPVAGDYGAANVITVTGAGNYDVYVKDGKDCVTFETITVSKDPVLTITALSTAILCNGDLSVITVTPGGGQTPYEYRLENILTGIFTPYQESRVFNNIPAGDYNIEVRDARACTGIANETITEPAALSATANVIDLVSCNNNSDAEVAIVVPTGGTPPYQYSFDGMVYGATNSTRLTPGTHTVYIRDANLCIFPMSVTIAQALVAPTFTTSLVYNCDGSAEFNITPVDPTSLFTYTYKLNTGVAEGPNSGLGFDFANLPVGTHSIEIEYTPISPLVTCPRTEIITVVVADNMEFNAVITASTAISCNGGNDGDITVQVSNFDPLLGYEYSIDGAVWVAVPLLNTFTVSVLNAGIHTIDIRDARSVAGNCTINLSQTLNEPTPVVASAVITEVLTCAIGGGTITASAVGGVGVYEFQLENTAGIVHTPYGSDHIFTNVPVGNYTVFVRDGNGCDAQVAITIAPAIIPTISIVADTECYTALGNITITATGTGTGTLQYALNGGTYQTNNVFSNILPGNHSVTVRDVYGCEVTSTTITVFNELTLSTQFLSIRACDTDTDVTITANGGDGTYSYTIQSTGVTPVAGDYGAANVITVTAAGVYDVYVKDGKNCVTFETITVTKDPVLSVVASASPILCSGDLAIITAVGAGGEGPYKYRLENALGVKIRPYQSSPNFNNVPVGNYIVKVRDARKCKSTDAVTITEPAYLIASAGVTELVSCNNGLDAEVRITNAQGGTPFALPNLYLYSFDGGMTYIPSNISRLPSGTHTVYVQDANACTFAMEVIVAAEISAPDYTPSLIYDCDGKGIYTIYANDPTPLYSYTFNIDTDPDLPADITIPTYGGPTGISFPNLAVGTHTVNMNFTSLATPTKSVLLEESFGSGANTPISNIDPVYCYEPQDGTNTCLNANPAINDGEYSVTQKVAYPFGSWRNPNDHSGMVNGRFLAINVGGVAGNTGIIYQKEVKDIIPNRDITISLYAFNLLRQGTSGGDPSIEVQLVDPLTGIILATSPVAPIIPKNNNADDWHEFIITLNPGAITTLDIVIRTKSAAINGNDIAIDDIFAFQEPEQCPSTTSVTFTVAADKEFKVATNSVTDVTCNGGNDGSISVQVSNFDPAFGYQFSTDAGATWSASQFTNVLTVNGLNAGTHDIEIGYITDALGTKDCIETITEIIGEPTAVVASASITENLTCSPGGATITASAVGGGGSFTYQLEDTVAGILRAYQILPTFLNVGVGSYIVRAKDVFGCDDIIDVQIDIVAATSIVFNTVETNCYAGDSNGSITVNVTAGNGNYQFSINGSPYNTPVIVGDTSYIFSNLTAGTYSIDVRDQFNCDAAQATVIINDQLTATAILDKDIDCSVSPDGQITITGSGGVAPYSYEWSSDGGTTWSGTNIAGNIFTSGVSGDYIFRVTDAATCTVLTSTFTLTPATNPTFTVVATDVVCNGDLSGSLDVTFTSGLPPFVVNVFNDTTGFDYLTQTTGLPAGNYTVTVTDAKGCSVVDNTVVIGESTAISAIIVANPIICGGADSFGSIDVTSITGGSPEYTYILSNTFGFIGSHTTIASADYTFTGLDFGVYQLVISDSSNCEVIYDNIRISSPPDALEIDVSAPMVSCLAGATVVVTVKSPVLAVTYRFGILTQQTAPYYTFALSQLADNVGVDPAVATFTGLTPGVAYTFVVLDETNNCYYFEQLKTPLPTLSNITSIVNTTPVTCTGSDDGKIDFTINDYDVLATAIDWKLVNAFTNTDALPALNGSVPVNPAAPGVGFSVPSIGAIPPGHYYILFEEVGGAVNGCTISSVDFEIKESPTLLEIDANITQNQNCNDLGIITASAQYGTAPYEYQVENILTGIFTPYQVSPVFNVTAGDYKVFVKDAFNCIQGIPVMLTVPLDPSPAITVTADYSACPSEGSFTVSINLTTAGIPPYSIQINGGAAQVVTDPFDTLTPLVITGLNSGLNTFQITDSNGCSEVAADVITIVAPLEFNASITKLLDCSVVPNAEITISDVIGSINYTYQIDNITTATNYVIAGTALPVIPFTWTGADVIGEYKITITDTATNCTAVKSVFIVAALNPIIPILPNTVDALCSGSNDGSISITAQDNGIGPFTFAITAPLAIAPTTNNNYTATFDNLSGSVAGTNYTITITGANGCTTDEIVTIFEPIPVSIDLIDTTPFGCTIGDIPNTANITVTTVTGGNGTYTRYEFVNSDGNTVQDGASEVLTITFDSLTDTYSVDMGTGLFTINVYDSNGCLATDTETIILFDEINNASITLLEAISCTNTGENIQIDVVSIGGDPNKFEFSDDNGATWQPSNVFNDLAVGTHDFIIRHVDTGCTYPISHTIGEPNTFTPIVTIVNQVYCIGSTTGEVTFELEDTTYPGGFAWEIFDTKGTLANDADDTSVATGTIGTNGPTASQFLAAGSYYVIITQNNLPTCNNRVYFTITEPIAGLSGTHTNTPITCIGIDGAIEITANGGWGNYEYYVGAVPPGAGDWVSSASFTGLGAGTYQVWIKDMSGCELQILPVVVLVDPTPIAATLTINNPNCSGADGEIEVTGVTGGEGTNYQYQLFLNGAAVGIPQTSPVFSGLGVGAYHVDITDLWSCTGTTGADIQLFDVLIPTVSIVKEIDCTLTPGGALTVAVTGGSGNYSYSMTQPDATVVTNVTGVYAGLTQVGVYSFIITDTTTLCTATITEELFTPSIVVIASLTPTDALCIGDANGTITVNLAVTIPGTNDEPPYSYEITVGPVLAASQSSNVFTGLPAGTYTVVVTGANACSGTQDITINDPTPISVDTVDLVQFGCTAGNTPNTASITVTNVNGGTGIYNRYEFINSDLTVVQNGASNELIIAFDSLTDSYSVAMGGATFGEFTVNVYDSNGCIGTRTETITIFDEIKSANVVLVDPISCINGGDDIRIDVVSAVNDMNQFEYSINGNPYQASNLFSDLAVGTHQFLIRHIVTLCEYSISHTVVEPNTFTAVANVVSDVNCIGTATGEVSFEIIDPTYAGGFNWTVFDLGGVPIAGLTGIEVANGPTPIQNIDAGSYYVEITQTAFPTCTNRAYFNIAESAIALTGTYTTTDITCLLNDGTLDILPVGGWGTYEYYVGAAVPAAGDWVSTSLFTGLDSGITYQVWLRDAGGCEIQLADAIFNDPALITGNLIVTTPNCNGNDGVLEVTGVVGGQGTNYQYQLILNGTAIGIPQSSPTFSGLGAGDYEVEITDQWSCNATIPGVVTVLFDTLIPVITLVKEIDCIVTSGEITVSVTGGSGNYSYDMTQPDTTVINSLDGIYTGLTQVGVYSFTITDTLTNCVSTVIAEELFAPSIVLIDALVPTDALCEGDANGTITVNLAATIPGTNDEPIYTYEITVGPIVLAPQNSNVFTGLPAGTYTVLVTSVKGCTDTQNITIGESPAVSVSATANTFVCTPNNLSDTVTVTATALDGNPGYLYSIDGVNFTTSNTFDIVDTGIAQTITVTVKDANGCTATDTVTINPLPTITAIAVTQNIAISCLAPENVTVTVTGGSGDFTYELLPIGTNTQIIVNPTADFDLPAVGSYTFKVIDNVTGCFVLSVPYIVAPFDTIAVNAMASTPIACFGDANGTITFEVLNYGDNYTWDVLDELGASVATGTGNATTVNPVIIPTLPGGNYTVYVVATDPAFCDATSNVITIASPSAALNVNLNVSHELTCNPGNDGEITAQGEFGWGSYTYQLSQGATILVPFSSTNVFGNLAAGIYTVTVKDAGCEYLEDIEIIAPTPITATAIVTSALVCFGELDGEITVTANGGQGAGTYLYSLINATGNASALQTSNIFRDLAAGTYTVLVTDNLNCDVITAPVTIVAPNPVIAAARITNTISCTMEAIVEVTASGGDGGPYTYSVDGITFNAVNTFPLNPTKITTYQFFVKDGSGCVSNVSNGITVRPIVPLKVIIDGINANITCYGGNNAVIAAITSGGMGNYRYELLDGNDMVLDGPQNSSIFTDLGAGIYKVKVTSLDCEEISVPFQITEPKQLQLAAPASVTNVSCFGEDDGTITVNASGGTGKLIYSIDQNKYVNNNVFTNLSPGSYTVTVQDENGCYINERVIILEPALLAMTFGLVNQEKCINDQDASIEIVITGGTAPYFTKLNTDGAYALGKLVYDNLLGGFTYVIYVEDSAGCTQNLVIKLDAPVDLNFGTTIDYACDGNIKIIAAVSAEFENDVTYTLVSDTLNISNTTGIFENLTPGVYLVDAEHTNGCIPSQSFVDIVEMIPTIVTLEETFVNTITAHVEFGLAPYEYSIDGDDFKSSNEFIVNKTGTYTVEVRDARGCISTSEIYIEFITVFIPNFFTPDGDGTNDYWYPRKLMAYPNIKVSVFDRYSRLIIEFRGPQVGWDGKLNGTPLPSGDYWYVIDLDGLQGDTRDMMGNFTLYR